MAEGYGVTANGWCSHAEGYETTASDSGTHAEGYYTEASSLASHAEGYHTSASGVGIANHAEGFYTVASGSYSHAGGLHTIATGVAQTAIGQYNVESMVGLLVVGNGTSDNDRSNALTVDDDGDVHIKGNLYTNCDADSYNGKLMTLLKIEESSVSSLPTTVAVSSDITSDMECIHAVLSNPSAQRDDWTVTTSMLTASLGQVTISGSISGTTDITLYLAVPTHTL